MTTPKSTPEASQFVDQLLAAHSSWTNRFQDVADTPEVTAILSADSVTQVLILRECIDRIGTTRERVGDPAESRSTYLNLRHNREFPLIAANVAHRLLRRRLPLTSDDIAFITQRTAHLGLVSTWSISYLSLLLTLAEKHVESSPLTAPLRNALVQLRKALSWISNAPERKFRERIDRLLAGPLDNFPLEAGEAWSDHARSDLESLPSKQQHAWAALLNHCAASNGATPSAKWITAAKVHLKTVKPTVFQLLFTAWVPLVALPRTQQIQDWPQWNPDPNRLLVEPHMNILKGLAWTASLIDVPEISRSLSNLAVSCYKKVPKIGPRAVRVGNACIWSLGAIPSLHAVGQLAILRATVKFGTAQKGIERAMSEAAQRQNISRADLEELGVPTYGFSSEFNQTRRFGEARAELSITSSKVVVTWHNSAGKSVKSPPSEIKNNHASELKELKGVVIDAEKILFAQRSRLDNLLGLPKIWKIDDFYLRYLRHPIVGTIASRLIWTLNDLPVFFVDGRPQNIQGDPVDQPPDPKVGIWHPVNQPVDQIVAWRQRLAKLQIVQPFKQAHREIYILTDAERNTRTYSNRFAAHILKQHQFSALAAARGWRNKLRLLVDGEFPPASKDLPDFGLRAEFWIEGIGDDYGTDTNDSGVFHRISTDQVRFYPIDTPQLTAHAFGGGYAHGPLPIPLDQIPPLAFSEIMRDIDLFVGVCSVANDPTWNDGGPDGRHRQYWHDVSFGDLNASAQTRKEILAALLPRLAIAHVASLSDKFLLIQGSLRSYKIHLGSANILMAPNDQYLCIVPDRSPNSLATQNLHLPFEGDTTLALILSKALLLANDAQITDPSILRQIRP